MLVVRLAAQLEMTVMARIPEFIPVADLRQDAAAMAGIWTPAVWACRPMGWQYSMEFSATI